MSGDSNARDPKAAPQSTQNPEGEMPEDPAGARPQGTRSVSGTEAAEAGRRAEGDSPATREEVVEQSAYKDNAADLGQQAASAEESKKTT
jgi:hypothetical protein